MSKDMELHSEDADNKNQSVNLYSANYPSNRRQNKDMFT